MCYHPISIPTPQGQRSVPCGHCLECLRKYMNDWSNRFDAELKACDGKAVFFTLTYDDANVPKNYLYDGEIYRSRSAYGFSNVDPLTDKLRAAYRGERKKYSELPYQQLLETGIDCSRILDFNIERKDSKRFVSELTRLYHDYYRLYDAIEVEPDNSHWIRSFKASEHDFDSDCDLAEEQDLLEFLFKKVEVDDFGDCYDETYHPSSLAEMPSRRSEMRERPIMMFNSVRAQDVQDWIKRGRIRLERKCKKDGQPVKKFKFFVTAEYGPRTLRPHYHGIIFGVTADEVRFMCLDWQRRFGRRIQWEDVDLSKGAGSYVAKYCSKGFFEHPLCARNFFYFRGKGNRPGMDVRAEVKEADRKLFSNPHFTEYHSKHYERCIEIFGVDKPIVDPVFHLVSQGLGIAYVDSNLERFTSRFDHVDFARGEVDPTIRIECDGRILTNKEALRVARATELFPVLEPSYLHVRKTLKYHPENESELPALHESLEWLYTNFKYVRVSRKNGKEQVFKYSMPKYYRKKILSDGLRAALANYVQCELVRVYQEKYRQVCSDNPSWSDAEVVDYLDTEEKNALYARMTKQVDSVKRYLNKSKI